MENLSLGQLIISALKHFDEQNIKYLNLINTQNININIKSLNLYDLNANLIIFYENTDEYSFNYELLGYFDNQTNIWIWGWVLPNIDYDKTNICRNLLNYGLKLEPNTNSDEHYILKSFLLNSRILLEEHIQLEINLAIISYILKDNILFIYPRKLYIDKNKQKFITIYYLIKKL
jgi:hypothetical protein